MSLPSLEVFRAEAGLPHRDGDDKGALSVSGGEGDLKITGFLPRYSFQRRLSFPQVRSQVRLTNCSISYFANLIIIIINHKILITIFTDRKRKDCSNNH